MSATFNRIKSDGQCGSTPDISAPLGVQGEGVAYE
jgi:hypothetical protein